MKRDVVLLLGMLGCAHGPEPAASASGETAELAPEQVVQIDLPQSLRLAAGSDADAEVTLRIAPGYHVMSDQPENPLYIPTRVQLESRPPCVWGDASYPAPRAFRLLEETIPTFEGTVPTRVPLHVASEASPGTYASAGTLAYQACTATSCLFPVRRSFEIQVLVVP